MMCEKCYEKTSVQNSDNSVVLGVPNVSRWRLCIQCGHKFKSIELPESAHKAKAPDPSNPEGRTPFVKVPPA